MACRLPLGSVLGVRIYLHWSIVIFLVGVLILWVGQGPLALLLGFCWLAVITIHEFGHGYLARRQGFTVVGFTLGALHGTLEYVAPANRLGLREQAIIAWGGVLAQAILLVSALIVRTAMGSASIAVLNVVLFVFVYINAMSIPLNLIPIKPLDGAICWRALKRPPQKKRPPKPKRPRPSYLRVVK